MANTSMRNSLHRKNHKERAQPLHRARLGLLEKHKDYVHRARDYKSKKDRIKKLKEKAAFRNKDEFYFGMVKGKTVNGVAIGDRGNEALSTDVVKILKTQDMGYVKVQIAQDEKRIAKLRAELEVNAPLAGPSEWNAASELAEVDKLAEMGIIIRPAEKRTKGKGKAKDLSTGHVIFVEGREELANYGKQVNTAPEPTIPEEVVDLGWIQEEPNKRKMKKPAAPPSPKSAEDELLEEAKTHRMDLLTNLSALLARVKLLRQAEARLETTKSLMGKGGARKVREAGFVNDEKAPEDRNGERKRFEGKLWKWKLERKR